MGGDVFGQALPPYLPWIGDGMVSQLNFLSFHQISYIYLTFFILSH
jgi:hypothetical protein